MGNVNFYDEIKIDKVKNIQLHVENTSKTMNDIVNDIIKPYSKDLDEYVLFIKDCLADGQNPPTDAELEDFCMNLSTYIYFASGMVEQLGIRDDIAKAVYKEMYHETRASMDKGTVADKDSLAELNSQQELLTSICYNRAWKTMKAKVESAQELLQSCKKALSRRMSEAELTRIGG